MHGELENAALAAEASQPGIVTRLPVLGFRQDAACEKTHVLVAANMLLRAGVFVTNPPSMTALLELSTIRAFPKNLDFTVVYSKELMHAKSPLEQRDLYNLNKQEGVIRFCIYELPSDVLPRRLADDRVGYFSQRLKLLGDYRPKKDSWGRGYRQHELIDPFIRIIQRQRIRANKGKQEILYYVDHTVPRAFHEATKNGIHRWQAAFTDIGLGPVIRGIAPGDPDFPSDYDAADVRFNSISWCTGDADSVFAIGQSVADPRSGEILKANIVFTLGWLQSWLGQALLLHAGVPTGDHGITPAVLREHGGEAARRLQAAADSQDVHDPEAGGREEQVLNDFESADSVRWENISERGRSPWWLSTKSDEWPCRHHGISLKHRHSQESVMCRALHDHSTPLWFLAAEPNPEDVRKHLEEGIADLTAHEVGHTLGLRHNFRGSTASSLEDLQDPAYVKANGLTASVMDYLPANVLSKQGRARIIKEKFSGNDPGHAPAFSPVIGAYDKWVIKYGYSKLEDEANSWKQLDAIADEAKHGKFSFATDLDVSYRGGYDPYTAIGDLGSEPLTFHEDRFLLIQEVQDVLYGRAVKAGESFTRIFDAQYRLLSMAYGSSGSIARFVGGYKMSNLHASADCPDEPPQSGSAGDCLPPGAARPMEPVDERLQSTAAKALLHYVIMAPMGTGGEASIYGRHSLQHWSVASFGDQSYSFLPSGYSAVVALLRQLVLRSLLSRTRFRRVDASSKMQAYSKEGFDGVWGDVLLQHASEHILKVPRIAGPDAPGPPQRPGDDEEKRVKPVSEALKDPDNWNIQLHYITELTDLARCDRCAHVDEAGAALATGEVYRVLGFLEPLLSMHEKSFEVLRDVRLSGFLRRAIAKLKSALDQRVLTTISFR